MFSGSTWRLRYAFQNMELATPGLLFHLSVLAHRQTDLRFATRLHTIPRRGVVNAESSQDCGVNLTPLLMNAFVLAPTAVTALLQLCPSGRAKTFTVSPYTEGSTEPRLHTIVAALFRTFFDRKLHLDRNLF